VNNKFVQSNTVVTTTKAHISTQCSEKWTHDWRWRWMLDTEDTKFSQGNISSWLS